MTASTTTAAPARRRLPLPSEALDERSRRARNEAMAVRSFGTNVYEVTGESGGTYLVDLGAARCTCPDYRFRDARCKHLRRVAIEVTEGRIPPPGHVTAVCAECGGRAFVPNGAEPPHYCEAHRLAPGDRARDRETGDEVLIVATAHLPADAVSVPDRAVTVADYETNTDYPADDPVVGAVYVRSAHIDEDGPDPPTLRVYTFPRSRLEPVG
jgi:hypothetical protein